MSESFEDVVDKVIDWAGRLPICECHDKRSMGAEAGYELCSCVGSLKAAHEHELEQLRKAEYHRGFEDGRRSMDAEHRAIASKVMQVPYDDDAMEFLFHISAIICGGHYVSNKLLRDELVRLMGGVRKQSPLVNCGNPYGPGDAVLDAGIITTYDVLGNERHKAVCELRKIQTDACGFVKALAEAVGVEWQAPRVVQTIAEVRDKLIHLLGEEPICQEPPKTAHREVGDVYHVPYSPKMTNKDESGCESVPVSPDSVENRQDAPKRGDWVTQNDGTASITGELRKWIKSLYTPNSNELKAEGHRIADRTDAEHAKQCKLLDDSWQATCEQIMKDYEGENAEMRAAIVGYKERAAALEESERLRHELERERDSLMRTAERDADHIEQLVTQHTLGNLDEQQLIDQLREVMNGKD